MAHAYRFLNLILEMTLHSSAGVGTNADDVLFNSLLDACCRVKDIPRLERTLQKMKQCNPPPQLTPC